MSQEKLVDFYKGILNFASLVSDDKGYISLKMDEKIIPRSIDNERLVLPTAENLRGFEPGKMVVFHPLSESIMLGESKVLKNYKSALLWRLNYVTGMVVNALLHIVGSPAMHSKLNDEQRQLLLAVNDGDAKTSQDFSSWMVKRASEAPDSMFISIYLRRSGVVYGKKFSRAGIATFPFYQEISNGRIEKLRVKDHPVIAGVFKYIFSNIEDKEAYNFGSNSQVAPFLEALLMTAASISTALNDVISLFEEHMTLFVDDPSTLMLDLNWTEIGSIDSLQSLVRLIPAQKGNEGSVAVEDKTESKYNPVPVTVAPAPVAESVQTVQTVQPVVQQVVQQPPPNNTYATVYNPATGQYVAVMNPQVQQPVVMQQPAQPPIPAKSPSGRVSLKDAMGTPGLAFAQNPLQGQMMQQQYVQMQQMGMMQQQPQPSWASWGASPMNQAPMVQVMGPNGQLMMVPANQVQPMGMGYPNPNGLNPPWIG